MTTPSLSCAAAAVLGAAALAAAPGVASAAQTVGTTFAAAGQAVPVACGPAAPAAPCTYVADTRGYVAETYVEAGSVLTSWSALLAPGSQARPVLLDRTADRTGFVVVAKGDVVTAAGGVQRFPTGLSTGASNTTTIGVELLSGSVSAGPSDEFGWAAFSPALGDGETRVPTARVQTELMLAASAEADVDRDGLGDETQDPDRGVPPTNGGGGGGGGQNGGGGHDGAGDTGGDGGGSDRPIGRPSVTIEPRAILRGGVAGQRGYIDVYARNPNAYDLRGWIQVRLGRRVLGRSHLEIERQESHSWGLFRLPADARRRLLRTGRLKVAAIASIRAIVGPTVTVRRTITVIRGGASGYDGTYRGPGPVVIAVERGAIRAVTYPLNLWCTRSKRFMQRAMTTVSGFPVLLRKDGSFDGRGSSAGDTVTYRGRLTRRGTGRGYLSLWHTELSMEGGVLQMEQCFDKRDWTVRRDR